MTQLVHNDVEVNDVPLGLVEIHWKSGGYSLASISNDSVGNRRFHACIFVV